jgi:hypothetical protein
MSYIIRSIITLRQTHINMLLRFGINSNRTATNKLRSFSKQTNEPTYHITINQPRFVAGFNLDKVRRIDVSGDPISIHYDPNSNGYSEDVLYKKTDPDAYEEIVRFIRNKQPDILHDSVCE